MDEKAILKKAFGYFKDALKLCEPCEWFDVDTDCEVKYMTGNTRYYWFLLCCGLKEQLLMRNRNISPKDTLRSNTKNYYKLFYKDNRLLKIENYIENDLRDYYLCFYKDSIRILKPFDTDKICHWLHYGIVTRFSEKGVEKEVWVDSNGQVIYSEYSYKNDFVEYEAANCLPYSVCDRIQYFERGKFFDNGTRYERTE